MATSFDPVPVGGARRGGPNRGVVAATLLVAFVAIALSKPWELGQSAPNDPAPTGADESSEPASAGPEVTDGERPAGDPRSVVTGPSVGRATAAASWAAVAPALRLHGRWGVRALVDHGGGLVERWKPSSPPIVVPPTAQVPAGARSAGAVPGSAGVVVDTGGGSVRALGITAPPDVTPLDVRIWWVPDAGDPIWLDARPVDPAVPGAHLLLLPPRRVDGTAASWPPGRYRVDLLLGRTVVRMTAILPAAEDSVDRAAGAPFGPARPAPRPAPANPYQADLGGLEPGAFVVADGVAVNVASRLIGRLDAGSAWLDADLPGAGAMAAAPLAGERRPATSVGSVWLPGINGIGVMLPPGARLEWASLDRLAPARLLGVDAVSRSVVDARGGSPSVLFAPPHDGTWLPGTYVIDLRYVDGEVRRSGSHHVTILPAPIRRSGALTSAVRAWASSGGEWGILSGLAEPLDGGPADAAIRWWGQAPNEVSADPALLGADCTGAARIGRDAVIGLAHPASEAPDTVRVERLFEGGRALDVPVQASLGVARGLSIVTGAAERPFAEGYYRVTTDPAGAQLVFCVGADRGTPDAIDPASASTSAFEEAAALSAALE